MFVFLPEILLHVSRGVRWDSDHVVLLNDDLEALSQELVRGNYLERMHIGLDFFDASINRVAAWVIGTRNMIKALLKALLEPVATLRALEADGDYTSRLALLEEQKTMPFGAVWDYYCDDEERAGRRRVAGNDQAVREGCAVEAEVRDGSWLWALGSSKTFRGRGSGIGIRAGARPSSDMSRRSGSLIPDPRLR